MVRVVAGEESGDDDADDDADEEGEEEEEVEQSVLLESRVRSGSGLLFLGDHDGQPGRPDERGPERIPAFLTALAGDEDGGEVEVELEVAVEVEVEVAVEVAVAVAVEVEVEEPEEAAACGAVILEISLEHAEAARRIDCCVRGLVIGAMSAWTSLEVCDLACTRVEKLGRGLEAAAAGDDGAVVPKGEDALVTPSLWVMVRGDSKGRGDAASSRCPIDTTRIDCGWPMRGTARGAGVGEVASDGSCK